MLTLRNETSQHLPAPAEGGTVFKIRGARRTRWENRETPVVHILDYGLYVELQQLEIPVRALLPLELIL